MDLIQFVFCSKFMRTLDASSFLLSDQTIKLAMYILSYDTNCIWIICLFSFRGDIRTEKGSCWFKIKWSGNWWSAAGKNWCLP